MAQPSGFFSKDLNVKGWFGAEPLVTWFDEDLLTAADPAFPSSASDSTFTGITTTSMVAISDVLQVRTNGAATLTFTGALTFEPQTLTNGTYNTAAIWRYRTVGGSWTDVGTEISALTAAEVAGGSLTVVGDIDVGTTQALSANTNYEVQLYARRILASPANTINFSGTASVSGGTAGYTITAATGSFTYSGNNANTLFNRKIVADAGTYTYSGNNANTLFNRRVIADAGSYTYSGNAANTLYNRIVVADPASFSYSGDNANVLYNRVLPADTVAFSYSGNNATLTYTPIGGFTLTADTGSFSYSGNNANLKVGFLITADTGAYTYSGNNANTVYNRRVIAEAGSYSYSGNAANVLFNRRVAADTASFSYSGNNAGLLFNRKVVADTGAFTYAGNNANLVSGRKVVADTGAFTYSGNSANLLSGRRVTADTGSYSYSGNSASILYNRKLVADTGSFSYDGGVVTLTFASGINKIYLGTISLDNLRFGTKQVYEAFLGTTQVWGTSRPANTLSADGGVYTYSGNNATLGVGKTMIAGSGTYTLSGSSTTLTLVYAMSRYATINDDNANSASSITATFNTDGTISFTTSSGDGPVDTDFTHWHNAGTVSGIGNSRWAKRTFISGDAVTGTLDTSLVALSASKAIAIQTVAGEAKSGVVLVEFYSDSGGTTKVGQITLTITANI